MAVHSPCRVIHPSPLSSPVLSRRHNDTAFAQNCIYSPLQCSSTSSAVSSLEAWPGAVDSHGPVIDSACPVHIAVIGVGFVGEALLKEFSRCFQATGFDISPERVEELRSRFSAFPSTRLSCNEADLDDATHYLIAVPTLLKPDRSVDLGYVSKAVQVVLRHARPGACIVLESSVTVGTTRRLMAPYSAIFHCGMSPERVDPGRAFPTMDAIPKIISGLTPAALAAISRIYSKAFTNIVPVSRPEVAEFTKLFENCYRMVNIAYVNEMADACRAHGINPTEMIDAAATKPYGFQKFIPGLGVGGHCIPVNPFYLLATCKNLPVLERATKEMAKRPWRMAKKFHRKCKLIKAARARLIDTRPTTDQPQPDPRPSILVVGVAFKPGQAVTSCSPGLDFSRCLQEQGCARLEFHDPLVAAAQVEWMGRLPEAAWTAELLGRDFDGIAVCMRQQGVEWAELERVEGPLIRFYA